MAPDKESPAQGGAVMQNAGERPQHDNPVAIALLPRASEPVSRALVESWQDLSARLSQVTEGAKDGPAWMPAAIDPGPRTGERVREVTALVLDVEARTEKDTDGIKRATGPEPPSVDILAAELSLIGWRSILHTTHSHHDPEILPAGVDHRRYRLVIALSRPLQKDELRPLGLHVASVLGIADAVDTGCLEPARLSYLPRAPRDRLSLFQHEAIDGQALDVDSMLSEARKAREALQKAQATKAPPLSGSVIDAFNAAHGVGEVIEAHGYPAKARNRWLYPQSTSGMPGVRLLPESDPPRIYSSHAGDPLNNGHAHDAFSVFCVLGNDGDMTAAVREAARLLGMDPRPDTPAKLPQSAPEGEHGTNATPSGDPFAPVPLHDLDTAEVPEPVHIVAPYLPVGVVTMLGAHGGTGKTFLALILAACVATGRDFMSMPVQRARVVFYSAEDGKSILRWRLRKICRTLHIDPGELAEWLTVLDVTDTDPALFKEAREAGVLMGTTTTAHDTLTSVATRADARLVIIDNASDTFEAGENDRARVRGFVRSLAQMARKIDGAVLLLAHIDKNTAKAGTSTEGYSGSTAWHNSVRSRLFLSDDNGDLKLVHQKANLGRKADPLSLAWDDGMIVPARHAIGRQAAEALTEQADAENVLHAIQSAAAADNVPTARTGPTTTWNFLKKYPDLSADLREKPGQRRFWDALTRLERAGHIYREEFRDHYRNQRTKWMPRVHSSAALYPPIPPCELTHARARVGSMGNGTNAELTQTNELTHHEHSEAMP